MYINIIYKLLQVSIRCTTSPLSRDARRPCGTCTSARYIVRVDPSGGGADSFALSVVHAEGKDSERDIFGIQFCTLSRTGPFWIQVPSGACVLDRPIASSILGARLWQRCCAPMASNCSSFRNSSGPCLPQSLLPGGLAAFFSLTRALFESAIRLTWLSSAECDLTQLAHDLP